MTEVLGILFSLYFWLLVIGGLAIWYLIACLVGQALLRAGEKPFVSARKAIVESWVLVMLAVAVAACLLWKDLTTTVVALVVIFVITGLIVWLLLQNAHEVDG